MAAFNPDAPAMASPSTSGPVAPLRHSRSRTQSVSSDRPSTIAHSLMSAPLSVSPEAAFVAASAASQIVTNDHDAHSETWYDQVGIEPSGETALVSTGALQLANNFIDHILFNIIATAKSTRLSDLRNAVGEVLKPKLAQDAINNADEELREYLGGGDIEDLEPPAPSASPRDWDLELAWKRTRLRCMVYSSLGDMEEEDEDYYMEQEHLRADGDDILSETVSPAVAIFLTSILEFMGEQVLVVSGQAAFNRLRLKYEKELRDGSRSPGEVADRIIVDELDMERVALDRTFGRLWRAWKKRIRSPTDQNFSRPFSRSSFGMSHARQDSSATDNLTSAALASAEAALVSAEVDKTTTGGADEATHDVVEPTDIALPLSPRDVDEIEVPGLVCYSDDDLSDDEEYEFIQTPRPASMIIWPARHREYQNEDQATSNDIPPKVNKKPQSELDEPESGEVSSRAKLAHSTIPDDTEETERDPSESKDVADGSESILDNATLEGEATDQPALLVPTVDKSERSPQSRPRARSQPGASRRRRISPVRVPAASTLESQEREVHASSEDHQEPAVVEDSAAASVVTGDGPSDSHVSAGKALEAASVGAAIGGAVAAGNAVNSSTAESTRSGTELADELDEEPQIMTSSRISVYGAPEGVMPSPGIPVRSNSIRSARIIDVPSRSPTTRSRNSSVDTVERSASRGPPVTAAAASIRSPRMPTPPIAEEPTTRYENGTSAVADSHDVTLLAAPPKRSRPPMSSGPQSSGSHPPPIKSTMSSPLAADQDARSANSPHMRKSPLPTLPERNASRPNYQAQTAKGSPESPKVPRQVTTESPPSASSKFRAVRSAEESSASNNAAPARAQDVARNFEELIHSDQTLQYTLTPENMRDISASSTENSIGVGSKGRRSDEAKLVERSRSSSIQRSMSVTKPSGLNSHPVTEPGSAGKLNGPVPRSGQYSPTKTRSSASAQQARDARVPRESLQDFAAFIRSTGPPGEPAAPQRVGTGGSGNGYRQSSGPVTTSREASHGRTESANRIRQTARDATVSEGDSAELADFLRRGPPGATGSGARVQRQGVTPRSAPDYDNHSNAPVRNSQASTTITEASAPSSLNSSTALLGRNKPAQYSNNFDDGDMMPQRKQRRVRDPYAIDFSDEEDDDELFDETPKPKAKPKQEESLIDFLKNYEPPPEPVSAPVVPPTLPKKRSASNLMARLRSNGHSSSNSISSKQSGKPSTEPRATNTAAPTVNRGYTPITVNIPPDSDKLGSFFDTPAPRAPQSSGRVPMKRFEPRDAVSASSRTSDLAAFLRDSEPPPANLAMQRPGPPEPQQSSSSGLSRVFDRRKKTSGF
ncbi:uncharacterized protein B0I36DRAFT_365869 [Microdochium trichocladiopsis]|uniref:Flo11 n=1 Tax=Microdochium trichocladiopsis TaxID=1682393 RepID=A0A9P8Y1E0_9PEZI|nr:uncharacterized protein B0I36DRAFT_365869 [Microdochium trichocladiopsis]KAH7026281.1 hypothetical protein B0I36DRAFT_365869 [Microdochium trichocladiopsis]